MTENEAIERLKCMRLFMEINDKQNESKFLEDDYIANKTAIQALEEIQQYRAIGTVEDIEKDIRQSEEEFDMLMEYRKIGTIEEFKDLKEKSVAKKPRFYAHNYYCTECGNLVGNNEFEWQRFLYCDNCGAKIDWQ